MTRAPDTDARTAPTDPVLMAIHADILFTYDERGRMVRTNEPESRPAPRLFLGVTMGGYVPRFGDVVPDKVARRLTQIIHRQPAPASLDRSTAALDAIRETLTANALITNEGGGPVYRFPRTIVWPDEVVQLTDTNIEVVRESFPWLYGNLAAWEPCFSVVRDGTAVSVCFSSRIGVNAAEAGVETLPAFQGRGHAVAVTAAWGALVRAGGRIPLYSTAWDNPASQGVARRSGLIMFGSDTIWA